MNDLTSSLMGAPLPGSNARPADTDPLAEMIQTRRDAAISRRIQDANAEQAARVSQLARELDYPETLVSADLPAFEARAKSYRAQGVIAQYPAIGAWSAKGSNADIAADDYDKLGLFGKAFYGLKNVGGTLAAAGYQALGGFYGTIGGVAENLASISPETSALFQPLADYSLGIQKADKKAADAARPQIDNWVVQNLMVGLESVPVSLAAIGASFVGSPAAGAAIMGTTVGGNEYATARDAGLSPNRSLVYGASQGLVEYVTEKIPVSRLVGDLASKSPLGKTLLRQLVAEIPGEQAATFLQDLNEWATINPDKTLAQFVSERPIRAAETLVSTVGGVGATTGVTLAAARTVRIAADMVDQRRQAAEARASGQFLDEIAEAVAQSKTAQRSPDAIADLVQQLGEDGGVDQVYLPAEAVRSYMQSDSYAGDLDGWRVQIDEAEATGGDLVLPVGELTRLATTPGWESLKSDIRLSAGGMSMREAEAFNGAWTDAMEELSESIAQEAEQGRAAAAPREQLLQSITEKLSAAGMSPSMARQNAEFLTQRAVTRALRMGRDLAGTEYDGLEVRQMLPANIAAAQKADQLDVTISVMKGKKDARQSLGPSLMDFIAKGGGITDKAGDSLGGDLKAMGADAWHKGKPGRRRLIRDNSAEGQVSMLDSGGLGVNEYSADAWAQRAWEAGYFPEFEQRPTANDLLDAIAEGVAGRDRHLIAREKSLRDAAEELRALLENRGVDPDQASRQDIRAAVDAYAAEQAEGFGFDQSMSDPVATLTGEEIAPLDAETSDLRKAARAWFNENLKGTIVSNEQVGEVQFTKAGINKAISSSANPTKLRLFPALSALIEKGQVVREAPVSDPTAKPNVRRYLWLEGAVDLDGEIHRVSVNLEERTDGRIYYNHTLPDQYYFQEEARSDDPSKAGGSDVEAGPLNSNGRSGPANRRSDAGITESGDAINMAFNAGGKQPRGRILFPGGQSASAIIELYQTQNPSTFLHESGHLWLEELREDAADTDAPQQVRDDWQIVQDWFAANGHPLEGGNIPVDAHELWARGVERYLMEGKAPSPGLQRLFQTFKAWMISLYNSVARLDTPISDEVRGVMDRLIASDEELADAIAAQHLEALFPTKPASMTDAEYQAYQNLAATARDQAQSRMLAKTMNAVKRRVTKEWREREEEVRQDVSERIDALPEFRALRMARETPLDSQWIKDTLGEDATAMLPKDFKRLHKEGGVNPDEVAELAGFRTGDEMVRALMGIEIRRREMREAGDKRSVRKALIDQEVEGLMLERFGDPFTDGSIEQEALAAAQSDELGAVMGAELRVLGRMTGQRPTPYNVAKNWAERQITDGRVRDVASRSAIIRYERAAAKAGRAAMDAVIAKDHEEAFRQKQSQMLNNALVAAARRGADQVDEAVKRLEKWAKRRTVKGVDQDYLERAQLLLEQVEMKERTQRSLNRQESFEAWAAQRQAEGYDVVVPPSFAESIGRTHWTRLKVGQLLALNDAVVQIIHLGRHKQSLLDAKEERDYKAVVSDAVNQIEGAISTGDLKAIPEDRTFLEPGFFSRAKSSILSIDASLLKMETVFDWLDGGKFGMFKRVVFQRIVDAQERRRKMTRAMVTALEQAQAEVPKEVRKRWGQKISLPFIDPRDGRQAVMTRDQLISMALNLGNEGNAEKLAGGYGWGEQAMLDMLNQELTPAEWTYVQKVWDIVDTLWPDIAALERRINGVEPDKVEAREVQTNAGTLRGGYFPVVYDTSRDLRVEKLTAIDADQLFGNGYKRSSTRAGSTNERTEVRDMPILLSPSVLSRHITEVVHDITHREAMMDTHKFLNDPRIVTAVRSVMGEEIQKQFNPWLHHISNELAYEAQGLGGFERALKTLRVNATFTGLAFRWSTVAMQLSGFVQTAEVVGPAAMAKGVFAYGQHPIEAFSFVLERSQEVASRMDTMDRDMRDMLSNDSGLGKTVSDIRATGFMAIGAVDRFVSVVSWMGAYNKSLETGAAEDVAIAYADEVIRKSQGSGAAKDLAAIMRGKGAAGEAMKMITPFYSFMSAYYQRQRNFARDTGKAFRKRDAAAIPGLVTRFLLLYVFPALAAEWLAGRWPDDDDEEGFTQWALKTMSLNALGPLPVVRDLANVAVKGFDSSVSSVDRFVSTASRTIKDMKRIADGEDTKRATRNAMEVAGYFGAPTSGQMAATSQFLVDVYSGDQDPEGFSQWWEGLTKGKIKDD